MAPTLLGESLAVRCSDCDIQWLVDASDSTKGVCWHCGKTVFPLGSDPVPGDVVEVQPLETLPSRGELIAFTQQGRFVVKRVVGIPGDTIDIDGLQLLINDKPIEDVIFIPSANLIPVDHDLHRNVSRWQSNDITVRLEPTKSWTLGASPPSSWLVYHHRSVHDQNRPSRVWDDYPTNLGLSRKLEGANQLVLSGKVSQASEDAEVEVVFWSDHGDVSTIVPLKMGQSFEADRASQALTDKPSATPEAISTTAETPIAIRMLRGSATIERLTVHRHVQYRLRRLDERITYPLPLADDQFFVLGDNVPVSVDSRDFGPIKLADIIGVVQARSNSTPDRRANPKSTRTIE